MDVRPASDKASRARATSEETAMKSLNAVLCYYHPGVNRAVLKTKLHWATEWGTTKQRFHFYESQAFDDNLIATYQAGTLPLAEPDRRRRRPALRPGGHGGEAGHDVRLHHRRPQRVGGYERARRGVRPRGQTRRRVRGPWKPPAAAARATQQPCAGRPVRPLHAAPGAAARDDAVLGVRPAAASGGRCAGQRGAWCAARGNLRWPR